MHVEESIDDWFHALVVLVRSKRLEVSRNELPGLDGPNDLPVHIPCIVNNGVNAGKVVWHPLVH